MRLSARWLMVLGAVVGLLVVASTDQILPADSAYQAQMRLWLSSRAAGLTAYVLLTFQIVVGLLLSHPVNQSSWQLSRRVFPWHEDLWVFVLAFLAAHIVSIVLDPFAGVGVEGALVPGLSSFRSAPVAVGTLALYALLVTGATARYTNLLPFGFWLRLHRLSLVIFVLVWIHSVTAGTDAEALGPVYALSGAAVVAAAAYRYWVSRQRRPSFSTSLEGAVVQRAPASRSPATEEAT